MIVAVNYANDLYKETQKYCTHTAYKYGVDKVFEYGLAQAIWYFRNLGAHGRSCENASL